MKFLPVGATFGVVPFSVGDLTVGCPGSDSVGGGAGDDVGTVV